MLDDVVAAQISGRVLVPQHVAEHPLRSPGSGIADLLGKLPAVLAFRRAQQALQIQASLPSWLSPDKQLTQPHLQRTQLLTPGKDACRVCRHGSPPHSHPRDSWSHSPPNSTVELGLASPGGVHAHQDHAAALAQLLTEADVPTFMHVIREGRDTPPRSSPEYIERLREAMPRMVTIATVSGRYYAMDRDKRWERVEKAYRAIAEAKGPRFPNAQAAIADAHASDVSDEFIVPAVIGGYRGMQDGDGLLCFNFRADRTRQTLTPLVAPDFAAFPRDRILRFAAALGMTQYSTELDRFLKTLFPPITLPNVLGEVVANAGRAQLRMAETEKYPHVPYFLNGGEETPYPAEDQILVPSPKVATYDLQPEMSAPELTDRAVEAIGSGRYDLNRAWFESGSSRGLGLLCPVPI